MSLSELGSGLVLSSGQTQVLGAPVEIDEVLTLGPSAYGLSLTGEAAAQIFQGPPSTLEGTLSVTLTAVCYPDCNADGVLTVADFGCFQTAFVAGCP